MVHSITIALVPMLGPLWALMANNLLNGVGAGAWDSSHSVWLVEMWPQFNAFLLQAIQFYYGVGTTVGPLFMSLYVYGERANGTSLADHQVPPETRERSLITPFALVGALQILGEFWLALPSIPG